jgi:lysophospholipase L1-like esterase
MTTIRTAYSSAKIVALRPCNGSQATPIEAAVDARVAGGDSRTYYVDTSGWLGSSDYTDGLHPNEQGSGKAARLLVTALQNIGLP